MKFEQYELTADEQLTTFEFVSEGPKGKIIKQVQFVPYPGNDNLYNLGFGDKDVVTGEIDDLAVTDNGDMDKVLETVKEALYRFCAVHRGVAVYATVSTPSRTRLYRMGIDKYYDKAIADFEIWGRTEGGWENYQKGKNYKAFIVQLKMVKFEV